MLFVVSVNDTGGEFASGVNDTGGKLPLVSTAPAANLPPVCINANSTTRRCPTEIMKIFQIEDFFHLRTLSCEVLPEFSKNGIIRGLGETNPCRKPEVKNLVALSL